MKNQTSGKKRDKKVSQIKNKTKKLVKKEKARNRIFPKQYKILPVKKRRKARMLGKTKNHHRKPKYQYTLERTKRRNLFQDKLRAKGKKAKTQNR